MYSDSHWVWARRENLRKAPMESMVVDVAALYARLHSTLPPSIRFVDLWRVLLSLSQLLYAKSKPLADLKTATGDERALQNAILGLSDGDKQRCCSAGETPDPIFGDRHDLWSKHEWSSQLLWVIHRIPLMDDIPFALAFPPFNPPFRPNATAAGSFSGDGLAVGATDSPVTASRTDAANWVISRERGLRPGFFLPCPDYGWPNLECKSGRA